MSYSEDPIPLRQHNNRSNTVVFSAGDSQNERNGAIALGCTSTAHSSPRCIRDVGQSTDLTSQKSPVASQTHAQQTGLSHFESPMQGGENWAPNETISPIDDASAHFERLTNHALSPSISPGYPVEDGIFERGSAYQNLFQSLRSQVFRTAQSELETLGDGLRPRSGNLLTHVDANISSAGEGGRDIYSHNHAAVSPPFELLPTQEYLLWKAWTEEVSIWVCSQDPEGVTPD
jgi:hypothetical protein